MTKPNDPAFLTEPKTFYLRQTPPDCDMQFGLTKREWMAAMAMQGILSNLNTFEQGKYTRQGVQVTPSVTILALDIADMLIAELNKDAK